MLFFGNEKLATTNCYGK